MPELPHLLRVVLLGEESTALLQVLQLPGLQ